MLRASAQLLRPGGRTAFFTIHIADGADRLQRRRAGRHGPPAVRSENHHDLLERAGFVDITATDHTDEFAETTRRWMAQWELHRAELEAIFGEAEVTNRQRGRNAYLRVVGDGILRRSLFTARRP